MYRVLIAEDEKLVRIGLKNSIDWEKFDMEVVADEPNGLEAFNAYLREKPDLIITDLRMPVMGGMELIAKIREKDKDTKIIILTCIEEFDYVKNAMNLNVSGYIIKLTMTDREIEDILGKVHKELKSQKSMDWGNHIMKTGIDLVKDKLLSEYLFFQACSEAEFSTQAGELNFKIKPDRLLVCVLEIDRFLNLDHLFNNEKEKLVKRSLISLIKEVLDNYNNGEVFRINDSRYLIILNGKATASEGEQKREIFQILDKIRRTIDKFMNISVSFGISAMKSGYGSMKLLYDQAEKALENKFFNGYGVFFYSNLTEGKRILAEKSSVLFSLVDLIDHGDDAFKSKYSARLGKLLESLTDSRKQVQDAFNGFIHWVAAYFKISDEAVELVIACSKQIQTSETFDDIIAALRDFFSQIKSFMKKRKVLSSEMINVVEYINDYYSQDLSLNQVAKHVNFSASYLSTLFKRELDVNFIEYLNDLRIEKAKDLLIHTYLKSYEVAEKVGFSDNTYFSKAFKKHAGVSPSEFRKQWGGS